MVSLCLAMAGACLANNVLLEKAMAIRDKYSEWAAVLGNMVRSDCGFRMRLIRLDGIESDKTLKERRLV